MAALDGYGALVTGGGSGIGEGCALALVRDGAVVTLCGRTPEKLDAAARRLRDAVPGAGVHTAPADVTVEQQIAAAIERAVAEAGALHAVVASAGGARHMGPLHLADAEAVRATIDLNMVGTLLTLKHAAPSLARTRGSFVAISSHVGLQTERFLGAYAASKAGLDQLVRVAADELGPSGVRVNSIRPGIIDNEATRSQMPEELLDGLVAQLAVKRRGTGRDNYSAIRWLCSEDADWFTGQTLHVNGGQLSLM